MVGKQRILIVGAGGHGKVMVDSILTGNQYEIVGIVDDNAENLSQTLMGIPIVGTTGDLRQVSQQLNVTGVAIAIGDNYIREQQFRHVQECGLMPVIVVHPTACISRFTKMGVGVTICAGAVVNAGTAIEDNVCVNTRASIDHDNELRYSCHVFPNATLTGSVCVQEFAYIGSGAVVIPGLSIGKYSYVGAGAVVVRHVPAGLTVAGVPAREIGCQNKRPMETLATQTRDA